MHLEMCQEDKFQMKCSYYKKMREIRKHLELRGMFITLIVVIVSWVYEYAQTHQFIR